MHSLILINSFEVPAGEEERFLKAWQQADKHLHRTRGFLWTRLHENPDPQAKYRFVTIAQWEPPQHFQASIHPETFRQIFVTMPFSAHTSLYPLIDQ